MADKITYNDKSHVIPYGTHEIQVWDTDMNEIKDTVNTNADELDITTATANAAVSGYQGVLLIADTPTVDGAYMAGESGTYTNAGGLVIDLTEGVNYINVSGTQTVFTKTVIPVNTIPTGDVAEGETLAVNGDKIWNYNTNKWYQKEANVPLVILKGIKEIKFYNADIDALYTMAVFRKNISASGDLWDVRIYEWTGVIGTLLCRWMVNSYVPSADIEVITLPEHNDSGFSADVTVDWSEIPDETDLQSQPYSTMGLNLKSYSEFIDYNDIINTPNIWVFPNDVNSIIKASVLDLKMYGDIEPNDYTIAVFRKKIVASDNLWDISIFEWTGVTFGSKICQFTENNYVPSSTIEQIRLAEFSNSGVYCDIVIDWSEVPDGTDLTSQKYDSSGFTGLSNSIYNYELNGVNKFDILLPENVYFIEGVNNRYWMYRDGLIENFSNFNDTDYNYVLTSDNGNLTYSKDLIKVINGADIVLTHEINALDFYKNEKIQRNILTKTTNFFKKTALTGINMNTIVIGDSYIDTQWGSGILEYLKADAISEGNTITLKGTRTSYGNLAEGRASWTALQYLTQFVPSGSREPVNGDPTSPNMNSPFMFSTDDTVGNKYFSFSEYLSTNAIVNVDNIVFFLGMNGGDGSSIDTMITNIKSALPSVNIFVCTVPSYQTPRTEDLIAKQVSRETQIKSYLDLFDGRQGEDIYVLPINAVFNRLYSYNNTESDILQYTESMVVKEKYTTDNHPNSSGAQTVSQMIHNYITYINS